MDQRKDADETQQSNVHIQADKITMCVAIAIACIQVNNCAVWEKIHVPK